jgi:hypothetical protein
MPISDEQWHTLRKNVSMIVKKELSIEETQTIVAVINVMESTGIKFNIGIDPAAELEAHTVMSSVQAIAPLSPLEYQPLCNNITELIERQEAQIKENMRYIAANMMMRSYKNRQQRSINICVEISDYQMRQMKPVFVKTMGMELAHRIAVHLSKYHHRLDWATDH